MAPERNRKNRLPLSYRMRLAELRITHQEIADTALAWHPEKRSVGRKYVTNVLAQVEPCPAWLLRQLDSLLAAVEQGAKT